MWDHFIVIVWNRDTADYVVPSHEKDATFIVTNFVEKKGQSQGEWDEDASPGPGTFPPIQSCADGCPRFQS